MAQPVYPLLGYLRDGVSATQAQELLLENDCLSFPQLRSGLFPAANFDDLKKDETGMSNTWLRDSACIGMVLLQAGEKDIARKTAGGVIRSLMKARAAFDETIRAGRAPEDDKKRPPVRYAGQSSQLLHNWANAQNDALGYSLQFIGAATKGGVLALDPEAVEAIDRVVKYLAVVEYWQDADSGHWEEIKKVNASSLGTVVGGLQAIRDKATDKELITSLIQKGADALRLTLPNESITPSLERQDDAVLIFLVEPQRIIVGDLAECIIQNAQKHLMGEHGFRTHPKSKTTFSLD